MGDWEWAKKGGGNADYGQEDEEPPDDDTTYNETLDVDAVQRTQAFGFESCSDMGLAGTDDILSVGLVIYSRWPDDNADYSATVVIEDNGVEKSLINGSYGASYLGRLHTGPDFAYRPSGGGQWTQAAVDDIEGKTRRPAVARNWRCSQRVLAVLYST